MTGFEQGRSFRLVRNFRLFEENVTLRTNSGSPAVLAGFIY